jgi:glycosyltransferase involved in cell wall biosynthesis
MTRPLVVLDALLLRPQPTGVGRVIIELTRELAAEDRGLDFAVLCTHPDLLAPVADRPGWRLIPCPGARGGTLRKAVWTQARLPGLVRDLDADLLHCLQFVGPLRPPCPTVVTVYDLAYRLFPDTVEEPRRSYYRALVPRTLHGARRVLAISEATAADIRSAWPDIGPRVSVARLGLPAWLRGREAAPVDRGCDAPFLFVGTLEPRKNLERLMRAYATFRRQRREANRPAPRLVLVGGRGWKDSGLRALLEPLVAAGDVVVLNYCDQEELWRQYRLARALLFPSLHEGFGLPILEAMVAGTPVLTSDRGAMAEVAGDAAYLVDPTSEQALIEGLRRLTDDDELRRDLVARGHACWPRWTWSETARATVAAYREALEILA